MARRHWSEDDAVIVARYKGLVYQLAFKSWYQLPVSVKLWVSPEDLVADAYLYILSHAKYHYKGHRAMKSTFLWTGVSNLFLNFALKHQTKKRFGWQVPLEEMEWLGKKDANIAQHEALDALARTYREASQGCRRGIKQWFGQENTKPRRTEKERQLYEEFRLLAQKNGLTRDDCRELMRCGVWIP